MQRWSNGAVYFGQWKGNKEHGKGAHFCPPTDSLSGSQQDPGSVEHVARKPKYSLFIGEFSRGYPTHGLLLEGDDISNLNADDFLLLRESGKSNPPNHQTSKACTAPAGGKGQQRSSPSPCSISKVRFDGRSAFWQQPTPIEKVGEFEALVRTCKYEARELVKTLFSTEKIEDVWHKVVLKNPKEVNLLNANPASDHEADLESAAAALRHSSPTRRHTRLEILFKTIWFHGTCVRNKAGYFPCPKSGKLFEDGQEFDVEYDGKSLLSDGPTPIKLKGNLTCTVPILVQDPDGKFCR